MEMDFVQRYLVSPVIERPYHDDLVEKDQMLYERLLRSRIAVRDLEYPAGDYSGWEFYYDHGNCFVDKSTFYSTLTYVSFDAVTQITSSSGGMREIVLWTYAAVSVWVNGVKVCAVDEPVYKPIRRASFCVSLEKGANEIYIRLQNLGVRDTRSLFALEFPYPEGLEDSVPDIKGKDELLEDARWLDGVSVDNGRLVFPYPRKDVCIVYDSNSPDYGKIASRFTSCSIPEAAFMDLDGIHPYFLLVMETGGRKISRRFEIPSLIKPEYAGSRTWDENFRRMLGVIASADGLSRGGKFGFYIQNILARKALGITNPRDREYFFTTLQQIEDRYDCSDFLISGVIRYLKNYAVDDELKKMIDVVLLNYRYWMDMDGSDAMCFWSENHSLLFYSCAMLVGGMYPDSYFPRAGMDGRALEAFGRRLCIQWFDDLEKYGYEEFLSTVYMNVTFACLLNIVDYADADLSKRASAAITLMLRELSLHTFNGSVIAPMGRVYRGVLYPSRQGAQALMNLVRPSNPTSFGEGWLSYFATTGYRIPEGLETLMDSPCSCSYSTGNALVVLKKTKHYILTSVQSPRMDGFKRWENLTVAGDMQEHEVSHWYTKSFNERFHGTTFFEPGVYGYQQHMWSAALSNEALLFTNHPGGFCDSSSLRPGYWFGNGVMPAIRQDGNMLGAVYSIPDDHPVRFTHVFLPACKFDSVSDRDGWIFMRKDSGYLALWCSEVLTPYDDQLAGCELRAYNPLCAYLVLAGSADECGTFGDFMEKACSLKPVFDMEDMDLMVAGNLFLNYTRCCDLTQFV